MASIDFKTSSAEAASLVSVEQNMRLRRGRLYSALTRDEVAPTLTAFPLMGVADFTMPRFEANGRQRSPAVCRTSASIHIPVAGLITANTLVSSLL